MKTIQTNNKELLLVKVPIDSDQEVSSNMLFTYVYGNGSIKKAAF